MSVRPKSLARRPQQKPWGDGIGILESAKTRIVVLGCIATVGVGAAFALTTRSTEAAEFKPCPTDSSMVTMGGFGPCLSLYVHGRTVTGADYERLPRDTRMRSFQRVDIVAIFDNDRDFRAAEALIPADPREMSKPGFYEKFREHLEQMK